MKETLSGLRFSIDHTAGGNRLRRPVVGWAVVGTLLAILGISRWTSRGEVVAVVPEGITPIPGTPDHMVDPYADLAGFDRAVFYWRQKIVEWGQTYGVDPVDVATLMEIESCGNPTAVSPSGALGLFQVMPQWHLEPGETPTMLLDADFNAQKGLVYFHTLRDQSGDLGQAYVGYNGGASAMGLSYEEWVVKFDKRKADELDRYRTWSGIRVEATAGAEMNVQKAWYEAGGASLCVKAADALGLTP